MRDSFVFYRSFYEAIRDLPRDIQGEIYTAIMEYGLFGRETENLKPMARSIFILIKPTLDANTARYLNAKKGGAPKGSHNNPNGRGKSMQKQTENKPLSNQKQTKNKSYVDVDVDVDVDKEENIPLRDVKEESQQDKPAVPTPKVNLGKIVENFRNSAMSYQGTYPLDMIEKFCDYWLEENNSGTKLRFQMEKTWNLAKRLSRWAQSDYKFNKQQPQRGSSLQALNDAIMAQNGVNGNYLPAGLNEI